MVYNPREEDCSIPYKTFNDLKDGDTVYVIRISNLGVSSYKIKDYSKEDNSGVYNLNCFKVKFTIPELFDDEISMYNGNVFFAEENRKNIFITTDERIANTIQRLMFARNEYQWNQFTSIFGNPMGQYAHREVVLC